MRCDFPISSSKEGAREMKRISQKLQRYIASLLIVTMLVCGSIGNAWARSLKRQMDGLFGPQGITISRVEIPNAQGQPVIHAAHFSDDSLLTLGTLVGSLAPSAADFPAVSTVPGFTFRFDPQLQVFERSSNSLGSVFVERPQTVGRGKFDFGTSFLYVDFDELNGDSLDGYTLPPLRHDGFDSHLSEEEAYRKDFVSLSFPKFTLRSYVTSFSGTYGITDRWDVNLLVPLVFTKIKLRAQAQINNVGSAAQGLGPDQQGVHFFDLPSRQLSQDFTMSDEKTGIGDVQLRTKYLVYENEESNVALASGLTLRLPTGSENNFQGLGDFTLTPYLALAREYRRFDFHLNTGVQINANDLARSRARYAAGMTFRLFERVALLTDLLGSSSLGTQRITARAPLFDEHGDHTGEFVSQTTGLRTDIVDLAFGIKAAPSDSIVFFFNCFVPLNNDGLRADFIPAAGVEVNF
jgi:hypothetical protein